MLSTTMHTHFNDYAGIALFVFTAAVLLGFRLRSARLKRQAQEHRLLQSLLTDPFSIAQSPPPAPSQPSKAPTRIHKQHKLDRVRLDPESREAMRREEENEQPDFGAGVAATPAPQASASVPYPKAVGSVAAMPLDVPTAMRVLVTIAILAAALFIVLAQHGDAEQQKWAYGAIGTILGFWLRG